MGKRAGKRIIKQERTRTENKSYTLKAVFENFYTAKVAEGRTERTLASYRENYHYFNLYLQEQNFEPVLSNMDSELFRQYTVFMLKEKTRFDGHKYVNDEYKTIGLKPTTVNARMKTLRTWFKFLLDENYITTNPLKSVKKVEENDGGIEVLSVEQLKTLLNTPNQRSYTDFRDYVLMNVLLDTFMRINEALQLTVNDVDLDGGIITIRSETSKSRKTRVIPIQKKTCKLLEELLEENGDFDTDYIFVANYGEALTANHFRHRLKNYCNKAGLKTRVHPHLFRHTGATMFLENGGDLRHLQMLLGHADLRMVLRYTHLSKQSLKNQHQKYSPLNNLEEKLNKKRKVNR